jgi:hypothetical protein
VSEEKENIEIGDGVGEPIGDGVGEPIVVSADGGFSDVPAEDLPKWTEAMECAAPDMVKWVNGVPTVIEDREKLDRFRSYKRHQKKLKNKKREKIARASRKRNRKR